MQVRRAFSLIVAAIGLLLTAGCSPTLESEATAMPTSTPTTHEEAMASGDYAIAPGGVLVHKSCSHAVPNNSYVDQDGNVFVGGELVGDEYVGGELVETISPCDYPNILVPGGLLDFQQQPKGTVSGTVFAGSRSNPHAAEVTITNKDTGFSATTQTLSSGLFSFEVPYGTYEMFADIGKDYEQAVPVEGDRKVALLFEDQGKMYFNVGTSPITVDLHGARISSE